MIERPAALVAAGLFSPLNAKEKTPVARSHLLMAGILIASLLQATPVLAADASTPAPSPQDLSHGQAMEPCPPFASVAIADDAQLAVVTGMADIKAIQETANVANTSTVTGNIINGDPITGTISIDGGSFSGFNGLALVSANTGNNVSINAAMNVNVAIQQ